MKLEDILPENPDFRIGSTGKVYRLRPPNMHDQVWLKKRYGNGEGYQKAIEGEDWAEIATVAFYLLSNEDKRDFLAADVKIIDDMGKEKTVHHSGPEMLLISLSGIKDMLAVMQALTRAVFISNPIAEELAKKKIREMQAKPEKTLPLPPKPATPKPSISSARSTDKASKRSRS